MSNPKLTINFQCPKCGTTPDQGAAIVTSMVKIDNNEWDYLKNSGKYKKYGGSGNVTPRAVSGFKCKSCGYILKNVIGAPLETVGQLYSWLDDHKMITTGGN